MKTVKFSFLFVLMAISIFLAKAQGVNNTSETSFFKTKFTKEKVWDAQRFPAYPVIGQDWTLSRLNTALEANGTPMAWAPGRYLMFFAEVDNANGVNSLLDDINNNGTKCNISLKLFESNGALVKVVSNWGSLIGIGEKGFMYEAEGRYGTFFSVADLTSTSVIIYKPSLAKASKLSEITKSSANSVVVNQEPVTNPTNSNWPLPKFHFKVIYNNIEISFQEVSGLDIESQKIEYRNGDNPVYSTVKMPGIKKYGNVILKKGVVKNDLVWTQYLKTKENQPYRGPMEICLLDDSGKTTMQWTLTNAWIIKITGTDIKSDGKEMALETMEVAHEGLIIKQ